MTKKYIKRQLILNELGITINSDIQKYYDHFENNHRNISMNNFFNDDYRRNDPLDVMVITLDDENEGLNNISAYFYEKLDTIEIIDSSHVFRNFEYMFNLSEEDIDVILETFMRHKLNL